MKSRTLLAAFFALAAAGPAFGQATISAGMSESDVRSRFGAPATVRQDGEWTYLFYHNGCPVRCGSDDVVFLKNGEVVAAVLRTRARRFTGPAAGAALEDAGGMSSNGMQGGGGEGDADGPGSTTIIRRDGTRDRGQSEGRARVGGVRVGGSEGGGRDDDDRRGSTTIIRVPGDDPGAAGDRVPGETDGQGGVRPLTREGAAGQQGAVPGDTLNLGRGRPPGAGEGPEGSRQGSPASATDDDDIRRAREGRVEPNTVRGNVSPDTMQDRRRQRERQVQPRVVPRGQPRQE